LTPESRIIQVVFDTPLRRCFDYLSAAGGALPNPGMRVLAPFGRQRAIGVVTGIASTSTLPRTQLKRLFATLDPEPLWDAVTFGLLSWAADYYHHPPGEVFFGAMPKTLRAGAPARRDEIRWRLSPQGREALAGSPRLGVRQIELLRLIGDGDVAAEAVSAAGLANALKALARRGWLESVERPESAPVAGEGRPGSALTADQSKAVL
jgi:primosomal protein N' (replication factor Y)